MRAHVYNPRLMRFCNADPIGFAAGTNWYVFCGNDPISMTDPMGLCGESSGSGWFGSVVSMTNYVVNGVRSARDRAEAAQAQYSTMFPGGRMYMPMPIVSAGVLGSSGPQLALAGNSVAVVSTGAAEASLAQGIYLLAANMSSDGTPRTNDAQNKQFRDAVKQAEKETGKELSYDQKQRLHRLISKQNYTFREMVDEAKGYLSAVAVGGAVGATAQPGTPNGPN